MPLSAEAKREILREEKLRFRRILFTMESQEVAELLRRELPWERHSDRLRLAGEILTGLYVGIGAVALVVALVNLL